MVVEKLHLPLEKHPSLYSIEWIKYVGEVKVIERCKVSFSNGKYVDDVYYDIKDMNVYYILFGKSWQYDTNA